MGRWNTTCKKQHHLVIWTNITLLPNVFTISWSIFDWFCYHMPKCSYPQRIRIVRLQIDFDIKAWLLNAEHFILKHECLISYGFCCRGQLAFFSPAFYVMKIMTVTLIVVFSLFCPLKFNDIHISNTAQALIEFLEKNSSRLIRSGKSKASKFNRNDENCFFLFLHRRPAVTITIEEWAKKQKSQLFQPSHIFSLVCVCAIVTSTWNG